MNIEEIKLNETGILEVANPLTGELEGATIEIFNKYSDEYANAVLLRDLSSFKNNRLEITVAITKEIKGFKIGDRELTSSKEDIRLLFTYCPNFIDDVDRFFSDNSNFFLKQ